VVYRTENGCHPIGPVTSGVADECDSVTSDLSYSPVVLTAREERALDELLLSMAHSIRRRMPVSLECVAIELHLGLERREPATGSRNGEGKKR
jgi:hypothetical protein